MEETQRQRACGGRESRKLETPKEGKRVETRGLGLVGQLKCIELI